MHTSFHPRQFRYHLALGTPNRKHIEEPEAPPPHRYLRISQRDAHLEISYKKIVIKNSVLSDLYPVGINKKKVRNVRKQIVQ